MTTEVLRELSKNMGALLPSGLSYSLIVWPAGEPTDCGYFSNTHRIEARVALEHLLGAIRAEGGTWELES